MSSARSHRISLSRLLSLSVLGHDLGLTPHALPPLPLRPTCACPGSTCLARHRLYLRLAGHASV
eukprot:6179606-Pleurochrysis_carterae.AAC.1